MNQRLVDLVVSVGDLPTLEEVDAMLAELSRTPRDGANAPLLDELLDLRAMLEGRAP